MKILFMCTGNVRRSVMAEAMFREMVRGTKYEGILMCQSAGIAPQIGSSPSDKAIQVLQEIGIDISSNKARKLGDKEIDVWDAFFVMSDTHAYIMKQGGVPAEKIYQTSQTIYDPDGKTLEEYRECRDSIKAELQILYDKLVSHLEV